eukprot:gene14865-17578_t
MTDSINMVADDDGQGNTCASYYGHFMKLMDLPTMWSSKDKSAHLDLGSDGLKVSYKVTKEGSDAALIRANYPITPSCGIFYFEVRVISKGRDGYIGVGVCPQNMPLTRLPGWEKNSYGYHGDDGHLFKGAGSGKNGIPLAEAANDLKGLTLYPCVGLRTPGESVEVNFGQKKFCFDISQLFGEEKLKIFKNMQATPTSNEEQISTQLVLGYLTHHGYPETVRLFANATGGISESNLNSRLEDIKNRQKMIKSSPIEETMAFGQNELYKFVLESAENESSLNEVFSLIAYQDPYTSPIAALIQEIHRLDQDNQRLTQDNQRLTQDNQVLYQGMQLTTQELFEQLIERDASLRDSLAEIQRLRNAQDPDRHM